MSLPGGGGNFANDLLAAVGDRLDQPFLITPGGPAPITYREFFDQVRRIGTVLCEAGAARGDRVLIQVQKSPDAVALYVACLWTGTVPVPLNPAFTTDERRYFIDDAQPAVLVLDPQIVDPKSGHVPATVLTLTADGRGTLLDRSRTAARLPGPVDRTDNDVAVLIYTSGTTGSPKGAALTHTSLRLNAHVLHDTWEFTPDDHLLHVLPIFHVHGLFVALHCAMLSAIAVTFLARFDLDAVVAALPYATVFMGVPTHYNRLLERPDFTRQVCTGMRLFTAGSAPTTPATFDAFTARTGHVLCERYGMSETGITTSNPYRGPRLAGTVGHALTGVELEVVDHTGTPIARDEVGAVVVRGRQIMREYWGRPAATAEAFLPGGWFKTGDVGSLDAEGRLTLQGRAGDMIISGGENIYPKEIELVLDTVAGVTESAVVGIPDPEYGERVLAVLAVDGPSPTKAQLAAALDTSLARYKHPRQWLIVDALPRNSMGKVQKAALRAAGATA